MTSIILRKLLKNPILNRDLYSVILINKCGFANHNNIIKSNFPDTEIPNNALTDFVFGNFSKFPQKIAVECGVTGKKYTFEEIRTKSINLNKSLRKNLKLQKGDVVAVLLPNGPEFPICMLGSIKAGLIVTMINPTYTPEEIKRQLLDANVKAIFAPSGLWNNINIALNLAQKKIPIIVIKSQQNEAIPEGALCFEELINTKCDVDDIVIEYMDDTILMPYSSGTTGLPKGVEHTHQSIIVSLHHFNHPHFRFFKDTTDCHQDVIPAILPFFHIYGLTLLLLNSLFNLSKLITLPKFTPESYIESLRKHKPHILMIAPPLVIFMANNSLVKKEYLQFTHSFLCGAAPIGSLDQEKLGKKFGSRIQLLQGYGLTETSLVLCSSPLITTRPKYSALEVLPDTSAKVVPTDNPLGKPLSSHQLGELFIKGPQVMKGYYNRPKETNESFVDGWFRTGDLVYHDEDEMFFVKDRLKELIKVKGFQVAPAELEEIIRSHSNVADAGVIGIPDCRYGEVPRAFVVPKSNDMNVEELNEFINEKVAKYKQIKGGIVLVESIPKTASGKILRKDLKRLYIQKK